MKKRIYSILLFFCVAFSFIPLVEGSFEAYAADMDQEIRVRIEGKFGTLFDETITVTDEVTGEDLLRTAIGDDAINGEESQYGLLINELLGESAGEEEEGYATSWGLYVSQGVVLESSPVGISSLQLEGLEELLLHIKAYDPSTYGDLTFIPRLDTVQEGQYTKLILTKVITTYDENWNPVTSEEVVEGGNLEIDGEEYTTDENGEVKVKLDLGSYFVEIYKEGENYPELIRETYEVIVEFDKFEEDDSDYELWQVEESNVKSDKEWNIEFNKAVLDSELYDNIVVVDSNKYIMENEIEFSNDGKTLHVNPPQDGYNVGEDYTLYIKNKIESEDGEVLNKSWKVEFTIVE